MRAARHRAPSSGAVWDAIVVGCGPVGAFAACLLARQGLRTLVIEKDAAPYSAPRAVAMDDEIVRLMGLHSPHLAAWLDRHVLKCPVDIRTGPPTDPSSWSIVGPDFPKLVQTSGYHDTSFFDQPSFERALRELLAAHSSTVRLQLGERVVDVRTEASVGSGTGEEVVVVDTLAVASCDDGGGGAAVSPAAVAGAASSTGAGASAAADGAPPPRRVQYRGRYLVAADGGASFVRRHLGIPFEGTTFPDQPWLVVDVETTDPAVAAAWQAFNFVCDPKRPFVHVPLPGPAGGRRYEFMLHPHESPDAMNTPPVIHRLLHSIGVPVAAVTIVRSVVYTFHAREAATWRSGRVLLLGDAAHCMPPFRGQGMCAGIRDAAAACWRVAAAVRNPHLQEALLQTYTEERRAHLRSVIAVAVTMGRLITLRNPVLAWLRNMVIGGAYHFPLTNLIFKEPFAPPSQLSIGLFDFHGAGGVRLRSSVGAALGISPPPTTAASGAAPTVKQQQPSGLRRRRKGASSATDVDPPAGQDDGSDDSSSASEAEEEGDDGEDVDGASAQLQGDMMARLDALDSALKPLPGWYNRDRVTGMHLPNFPVSLGGFNRVIPTGHPAAPSTERMLFDAIVSPPQWADDGGAAPPPLPPCWVLVCAPHTSAWPIDSSAASAAPQPAPSGWLQAVLRCRRSRASAPPHRQHPLATLPPQLLRAMSGTAPPATPGDFKLAGVASTKSLEESRVPLHLLVVQLLPASGADARIFAHHSAMAAVRKVGKSHAVSQRLATSHLHLLHPHAVAQEWLQVACCGLCVEGGMADAGDCHACAHARLAAATEAAATSLSPTAVHTRAAVAADSWFPFVHMAAADASAQFDHWFKRADADVVLLRPDRFVYGAYKSEELPVTMSDLLYRVFLDKGVDVGGAGVADTDTGMPPLLARRTSHLLARAAAAGPLVARVLLVLLAVAAVWVACAFLTSAARVRG